MWKLGTDGDRPEWETVETPFNISLFDVAQTTEGPYAVGSGGTLVANRGDGWEVVFDDGPNTRDNQMRAMDVTDDGKRVWLLGSSGAMACYDVEQRRKFDYSYPNEMTSTWEGITVSGERGTEKVLAANGSGEVLPFVVDGFDVDWGQLDKPAGKGSTIAALASTPDGVGFAIDTSGNAFKTTRDEGWKDIGIVNAQVKFYDIYAGENQRVYVAAGDGRIYRYDDSYHNWTPIGVTDTTSLRAIDVYTAGDGSGRQMVAMAANGTIYQRAGKERWEQIPSPTGKGLYGLSLGHPDVAVGKGGTIIERPRGEPRNAGTSPDGDNFDGRGETDDGDGTAPGDDPDDSPDSGADDPDTDPDDSPDSDTSDADTDPDDSPDSDTSDADTDPDDTDDTDDGSTSTTSGGVWGDTETSTDGGQVTADTEAREEVLVTLAEQTNLESSDIDVAIEQGTEVIEELLVEIAEDAGIDSQRVREALNRQPA